jgi:Protein of unknown function (DUF993)
MTESFRVQFDRASSVEVNDSVLRFGARGLEMHDPEPAAVRRVFAATRVVMKADYEEFEHGKVVRPDEIADFVDWDLSMAQRRRLDGLGYGIAEAMDTAQRFLIGWDLAAELIRRCGALDLRNGFIAGAGGDDAPEGDAALVETVVRQARFIREQGGYVILLPLVRLAAEEASADRFVAVYTAIIDQLEGPLTLHWLGEPFMPVLRHLFPGDSFERIMAHDPSKVRGVKLSLLDAERERALRRAIARQDQIVFTGDDFHFADLIDADATASLEPQRWVSFGDESLGLGDFSHALLGVFDAVAEPMSLALRWLARGERARYRALAVPCEKLGQLLFEAPTEHYKVGLAYLAWLNGLQPTPSLPGHLERMRNEEHRYRLVCAAVASGAISAPREAARRLGGAVAP